eukprot:s1922_g7.t1
MAFPWVSAHSTRFHALLQQQQSPEQGSTSGDRFHALLQQQQSPEQGSTSSFRHVAFSASSHLLLEGSERF